MRRVLYPAKVVYNGLGTPRRDGAVVVQEALDQRNIVAVGDAAQLQAQYPDAVVVQEVFAVAPAPVNAHTHLDLSDMEYLECAYEEFIRTVIAHSHGGRRSLASAERGAAELLRAGTRVLGDIVTREDVMRYLLTHPQLRGVAYWEVIGPNPTDAEGILRETEERIAAFRQLERPDGMRVGLSPHTPHTVSAPLLRGLADLARRMRLPVQIHVAESAGEVELHREGTGPLADLLRGFTQGWRPSGLSPVGYLESLGVLDGRPTLVHMVHVNDEDVRAVQRHGCNVVHCPRSNSALRCGRFPWELFARHGVSVGLGTDSRGSSPSLAVEEEVAAALSLHGERGSPQALVRAAVKGGYRALGLQPPRFVRGDDASILHRWELLTRSRPDPVHGKT